MDRFTSPSASYEGSEAAEGQESDFQAKLKAWRETLLRATGKSRREALMQATNESLTQATGKSWSVSDVVDREWRLLRALLAMVILLNAIYPFLIFSSWMHELCRGIAAVMVGGTFSSLTLYPDGSGAADYTVPDGPFRMAFVTGAGYTFSSTFGGLLLLFRRTRHGPRMGICGLAASMLLTCGLVVSNTFGIAFISTMGLIFIGCALKLSSQRTRDLFVLIAATCSLNVTTSIHRLFGKESYVNGELVSTDARIMSDVMYLPFWFWGCVWMMYALLTTAIGILFAIEDPLHIEEDDLQQHYCGSDDTDSV